MSFSYGTYRLVTPFCTLDRVRPHWPRFGLTRCIDITGLDRLGIPTFTAVRPRGTMLQVSSGKGITAENAECSAVMEALELHHAENPDPNVVLWASETDLAAAAQASGGPAPVPPKCFGVPVLPHYRSDLQQPWITADNLLAGTRVLLPCGSTYFVQPSFIRTSTNGLASGNSVVEATLHALFELIERDAMARLVLDGRVRLSSYGQVVDVTSIDELVITSLSERIRAAGCTLKVIAVPTATPVYTFMAFILDGNPLSLISEVHFGSGCHADPVIALCRAITEAAQSRLIFIHGSREDLLPKFITLTSGAKDPNVYRIINALKPTLSWSDLLPISAPPQLEMASLLDHLLSVLKQQGHSVVYRHVLRSLVPETAVVKLLIPSFKFNGKIF
jgi:ribosomal protein S12 methylthiotransferase accessory factor